MMSPSIKKCLNSLENPDPNIRIKSLMELGTLKENSCIPEILKIINQDTNDGVRIEGINALGKIQDISVGDKIIPLLKSDDIPIVLEAVNTMGILCANGFHKGLIELENLLVHTKYRVRKFTIQSLAKCGSTGTIEKLYDYFKREDISLETKELIVKTIGQIGGSRALEIISNLIRPSDEFPEVIMEIRRAAIFALGESRNLGSLELLGKVLNDKKEHKIIKNYAKQAIKKTVEGARQLYISTRNRAEEILRNKN